MGARITHLVLAREQAVALLRRAPRDRFVLAALAILTDEPAPGQPGGRARVFQASLKSPRTPVKFLLADSSSVDEWEGDGFTERGREVAFLVSEGLSNDEIAAELHLSTDTIKTHVSRLIKELGVRNRTMLAVATRERMRIA